MWIVFNKFFVPKNASAIALFPFVFISKPRYKHHQTLMNHEAIHLKQQVELLLVFFYVWYVVEFLVRWLQHQNTYKAYRAISFEREAYANEANLGYLQQRPFWHFVKYFSLKKS